MLFWPRSSGCCCTPTYPHTITCTVYACDSGAPFLAGTIATATLGANSYTGTTNSSGVATIGVPSAGTYTMTAISADGRMSAGPSTSVTVPSVGDPAPISYGMSPVAGYQCLGWDFCPLPVANTLFLTDSFSGATITLTYNGTNFAGTGTVISPGCLGCPGGAYTVNYVLRKTFHASILLTVISIFGGSPVCPGPTGIPFDVGYGYCTAASVACVPAFLATLTSNAGSTSPQIYCGAAVTWTVTE